MPKIGLLLAGCGRYDGTDVHEAVLLAAALERRGARLVFLAPDAEQSDLFDHATGHRVEGGPARRVLEESARLAPGPVRTVGAASASDLDGLAIPGGAGAVRGLCRPSGGGLGSGGLREDVLALLDEVAGRGGPVAAAGLAEVVLARWLDEPLDSGAVRMEPDEIRVTEDRNVVYAPGNLRAGSIAVLARSMDRLAAALLERIPGGSGEQGRTGTGSDG